MANWTKEEEQIVINELRKKDAFLNLNKCFLTISTKIDRSPRAICQHYYTVLRKNHKFFITGNEEQAYMNCKIKSKTSNPISIGNIWKKFINLFK